MVAAAAVWVGGQSARLAALAGLLGVVGFGHGAFVFVEEVFAGVVRRVNVDGFDAGEIGFLEQFERIQIITFNEQILRGLEVDAFFGLGEEGFADGLAGGENGLAFAGPVELIAFGWAFDEAVGEFLAEEVKVDGRLDLAVLALGFGHAVRKQPADRFNGRGCVFAHGSGILDF